MFVPRSNSKFREDACLPYPGLCRKPITSAPSQIHNHRPVFFLIISPHFSRISTHISHSEVLAVPTHWTDAEYRTRTVYVSSLDIWYWAADEVRFLDTIARLRTHLDASAGGHCAAFRHSDAHTSSPASHRWKGWADATSYAMDTWSAEELRGLL
jgi:hypothetical protein